jgi:hypothetical protein
MALPLGSFAEEATDRVKSTRLWHILDLFAADSWRNVSE